MSDHSAARAFSRPGAPSTMASSGVFKPRYSVKFRSRALTALNLLPSIATLASLRRSRRRHSRTNARHTLRIASPLSLRKIRNDLEVRHEAVGQSDQLDIALALPLDASARIDAIETPVNLNLHQRRWIVGRPPFCPGLNIAKPELT